MTRRWWFFGSGPQERLIVGASPGRGGPVSSFQYRKRRCSGQSWQNIPVTVTNTRNRDRDLHTFLRTILPISQTIRIYKLRDFSVALETAASCTEGTECSQRSIEAEGFSTYRPEEYGETTFNPRGRPRFRARAGGLMPVLIGLRPRPRHRWWGQRPAPRRYRRVGEAVQTTASRRPSPPDCPGEHLLKLGRTRVTLLVQAGSSLVGM